MSQVQEECHRSWLETQLWWDISCSSQNHGPCHREWPPLVPWRGKARQQPWMGTHCSRPDNWHQPCCIPEQLRNGVDACLGARLQLLPSLISFTGMKSPITN